MSSYEFRLNLAIQGTGKMYFFYVDESGNRDPNSDDYIYVLTAIGLHEYQWKRFYQHITNYKRSLISRINHDQHIRLNLSDCEMKSNWIRIPSERDKHKFLKHLSEEELRNLITKYYSRLDYHHIVLIAIIIDKRELDSFMDQNKLHRKAWELLSERIELFMREYHEKHNALLITDDMSKQENISLAMKHAYLLETSTSCGLFLKHILEMPLFVRSELSEGVQLADLCAYNFYRVFRYSEITYKYFRLILPGVYRSQKTDSAKIDGLKIFPETSGLISLLRQIQ
jgi:hypothetical protein